jgi:hypothetical protein
MLGHRPPDILIVMTVENSPQLISAAKNGLRFLPLPRVSYPAYNLGDWWQTDFCNLDNLRAERSPNGLRDVIAGTNESFESPLDPEEVGLGLSQCDKGACYLPSPVPNDCGDSCRGCRHDKYQRQRVDLNTSSDSAEERVNLPK